MWRGSLGRSLFSPVGPPFRLRVSHHLDHAPSPHPAHRTGQCGSPASGSRTEHFTPFAHERVGGGSFGASPVPDPGTGNGSGIVYSPALAPCASHITSDEAVLRVVVHHLVGSAHCPVTEVVPPSPEVRFRRVTWSATESRDDDRLVRSLISRQSRWIFFCEGRAPT